MIGTYLVHGWMHLHPQTTLRNFPLIFRKIGLRIFMSIVGECLVSQTPKT
jgi:hypothetical protein